MKRLQFEVNEPMLRDIESAMERAGQGTKAELLKNMLAFFLWGLDQKEDGAAIIARTVDGSERELLMPALTFAQMRAQSEVKEGVAAARQTRTRTQPSHVVAGQNR